MNFNSQFFGVEGLSNDDRSYAGSRYADVKRALFENRYYLSHGAPEEPLPEYDVTLGRLLRGLIPCPKRWKFSQAVDRALSSNADMRWGDDGGGFRRLLHPNGVCLFGRWIIDQDSPVRKYSGYFQPGSEALIIARYSTCCAETRGGRYRSLAMTGKLFPTTDVNHTEVLRTASFITQEDLGGTKTTSFRDAILRNAPDTTPWRRGFGLPILLLTALAFRLADKQITNRQLYQVAELGKPGGQPTVCPEFMQLKLSDGQSPVPGDDLDFRDEILRHIYGTGNVGSNRPLKFDIQVSDEGRTRGVLFQRRYISDWKRIGSIVFDEAVASYNGDFVLHFPHPPWRNNRNDSSTLHRTNRNR